MIAVANRIFVAKEFTAQFEERFRTRAHLVDGMPGFLSNMVLRPTADGDPYVVLTMWESNEAFQNWVNSDSFMKGHARSGSLPAEAFSGPNKIEVHEVFLQSGKNN